MSKIVNCTHLDSVCVEVLGEGRAVTIPAAIILAMDRVTKQCVAGDCCLTLEPVGDERTEAWEARPGARTRQGAEAGVTACCSEHDPFAVAWLRSCRGGFGV